MKIRRNIINRIRKKARKDYKLVQKTYFNAHRVHSPNTIIRYFKDLTLVELSGVTDSGRFIENIDIDVLKNSRYALGLF